MKRWRSRRGAIQHGVQKHKVRSMRRTPKDSMWGMFSAPAIIPRHLRRDSLLKLANWIFNVFAHLNCKLCLIPYEFTMAAGREGDLRPASRNKTIIYYLVTSVLMLSMFHKLFACFQCAKSVGLASTTFVCIATVLPNVVGWLTAISCHLRKQETLVIVNDSPRILSNFCGCSAEGGDDGVSRSYSRICNIKGVAIVLCTASTAFFVSMNIALASLFLPLPSFYYDTIEEAFGLKKYGPPLVWRLVLFPLEFFMCLLPLVMAAWGGMNFSVVLTVTETCLQELRKMKVKGLASRLHLHRRYMQLGVYHSSCTLWVKSMIVPLISGISSAIVLCLYIIIRPTDLPIVIPAAAAYASVALTITMFWQCYEIIMVTRASEEVIERIVSSPSGDWQLPKQDKVYLVKLGKGIHSLEYRFGDLMDMSLDVVVGTFDEIINQLIFLLQL